VPHRAVTDREVAESLPEIQPPGFVGRDAELDLLGRALDGAPTVVLVEGEAGIGKTRLVREFLAVQAEARSRMLVAVCPPFRDPLTLGPVVDALRQAGPDVRRLRLSALAGALRPLFPEWAAELPTAPEPLEDAGAARHRLFSALAELLDQLTVAVLVIEDAHWADEVTLELLLFLAARQPRAPSLVVTCRPEDVPADSLLRRLSAGMTSTRITLRLLDTGDVAGLVSSMLAGEPGSETFAAFLAERTEGLPLAVEECVRLLYERADLARRGGVWVRRELAEIDVPPTIRDAVLERAARLGPPARTVLRAAAVLADPADDATLAAVGGVQLGQARDGLAQALACGLLGEDGPRGRELICFRHVLAARAVYEEIPAGERRDMHLRAAQALQAHSPQPTARLARHFREAGSTDRWRECAEKAAGLALAAGDQRTAVDMMHELLTGVDLPASVVLSLMRKVPAYAVPDALLTDFVGLLRGLCDDDAATPAQRAELRFCLGQMLRAAREYEAAAAELEGAIPGLGHRPADLAWAMVWLGWPTGLLWPVEVHRRWLERAKAVIAANPAIPEADRLALTRDRVLALFALGDESGWAEVGELPHRMAGFTQAAQQIARPARVHYLCLGDAATRWGWYDEARRWLAAAQEEADARQYPRLRNGVKVNQARLDWCTGAWTGLAERAGALIESDDPAAHLEATLVAGLLSSAAGGPTAGDRLRQVIEESGQRRVMDVTVEAAAALGRLALGDGHVDEALAATAQAMQAVTSTGIWLWATDIAPVHARALASAGRIREAEKLVAAFAHGLGGCAAPAPHAALMTCRAIVADALGELRQAEQLFARAARAWDELPRPYDALLAREQQARCLLSTGRDEAGTSLLAEVFDAACALGARVDAVRVMKLLGERGVQLRRPWGGRRGYQGELSPREREVVELLVAGCTGRQIAEMLCLSPKTVEKQLSSARRKLAASNRAGLVAAAIRAGVVGGGPLAD
jgi:DNA-binding CsgD family transcriptional regulator/tetratricopeptide (TPR) repeat protein